jgi:N utilization substance protein A
MKGMRVQSIIRELRGEKIDIIEFSEDPVLFATHALSPAKISRVSIVGALDHHMEVIVDDTQLSLAIGKKGQNVRLAAKLLGWKIDIKSEEEKRQEVESQMAALVAPGAPISALLDYNLSETVLDQLLAGGVHTVERLGNMTPEDLEGISGIGAEQVEQIRDAVVSYYGQYDEGQELPPDGEAQEQQPTLELGEEGYNYSESEEGTAVAALPPEDKPASKPAIFEDPDTADSDRRVWEEAIQPTDVDQNESAKLNSAE